MIYLLIGYMWLFIHRPFEVWPWMAELRIERVYMLITIAYWLTQPKSWASNRINKGVGLLVVSFVLSTIASPYVGFGHTIVQNWFKLLVFYVLLMTSIRSIDDLKRLVVGFVIIMGLYELHSLREYFNGRGVYRMGTWRMIGVDTSMSDPNTFAASILYSAPMLIPVWQLATSKWRKRAVIGLLILGTVCILMTGSRSGFAALGLTFFCFSMASKYRWRVLTLLVLAAPLVWAGLSDDLKDRYMTLVDPSRGPSNAQGSALSRRLFFYQALEIWQGNPIVGVGPGGFAYATETGMQSHSVYAQTISNLGTVGVVAFGTLLWGFYRNYRDAKQLDQDGGDDPDVRFAYRVVQATGLTVLVLLFLGLAGHNLFRYTWLWYAGFSALAMRFMLDHRLPAEADVGQFPTEVSADGMPSELGFGTPPYSVGG